MEIDVPVIAGSEGDYVLRLRGDSMVDAGLFDGDNLIVKEADHASDGEIVVARVGREMTVKRWRVGPDGPWLEPANAEIEPIRGDVRVVGRIVGLFRSLEAGA